MNNNSHAHDTAHNHHESHGASHSIMDELICHFPYAVTSVAFSLALVSCLTYITVLLGSNPRQAASAADVLFHSFHFMHIVFAVTGTLITFFRFSKNWLAALIIGTVGPSFFCVFSDAVLPFIGGKMLGVDMTWHICFLHELPNVIPFLVIGVINGFVMSRHHSSRQGIYSVYSHFGHILVSSFASLFYLISHGFNDWYHQIGFVFIYLVFAVVVPCTLSDVVVPMAFARVTKKK